MVRARRLFGLAAAASLWTLGPFTGRAAAQTPAAGTPAPPVGAAAWLVADEAAKTVTLALQVTRGADGSAMINGYRKGEPQIIVPLNWTVQWDWRNADSTSPHSLVVMSEREKLPTEGGRAAFTNAMTRMVTAGLPAGQGDRTTFTADEAGWYWLLCGVPGHAIAGEYLGLKVDPEAKTASVKTK
jgi:sulfocyanin SoxE-like protein